MKRFIKFLIALFAFVVPSLSYAQWTQKAGVYSYTDKEGNILALGKDVIVITPAKGTFQSSKNGYGKVTIWYYQGETLVDKKEEVMAVSNIQGKYVGTIPEQLISKPIGNHLNNIGGIRINIQRNNMVDFEMNIPKLSSSSSSSTSGYQANATINFEGGIVYTGEALNGQPHGKGIMTWPNGFRYEGQWQNGNRHGRGIMKDRFGTYDGEWKDDLYHGQGTFTKNAGLVDDFSYKGEWKYGKKDGYGTYTDRYGTHTGYWKEDKMHGQGVYVKSNGEKKEGTWVNGMPQGWQKVTMSNGYIVSYRWENGSIVETRYGR